MASPGQGNQVEEALQRPWYEGHLKLRLDVQNMASSSQTESALTGL
jgi:hypothetical protein